MNSIMQFFLNLLSSFKKSEDTNGVTPNTPTAKPDKSASDIKDSLTVNTISPRGLLELADREGLSTRKYLDSVGVQTIGIGLTSSDIKDLKSWDWDKELTVKECVDLFKQHVKPYSDAVDKALKVPVTQNQFNALVSITYNIGIGGMKRSTFMKRINAYANVKDIVDAILMWNKPPEIMGRRKKEAALFQYGTYANRDGCVDRISVNPKTHKPSYKGRVSIVEYL